MAVGFRWSQFICNQFNLVCASHYLKSFNRSKCWDFPKILCSDLICNGVFFFFFFYRFSYNVSLNSYPFEMPIVCFCGSPFVSSSLYLYWVCGDFSCCWVKRLVIDYPIAFFSDISIFLEFFVVCFNCIIFDLDVVFCVLADFVSLLFS